MKKWWSRKPLSVFEPVIYLRNLPPGIGRAARMATGIFGLAGPCAVPAACRQDGVVGSYPAFSPLPLQAVVFCYGKPKITPRCAFHRLVPFPVRTFLSAQKAPRQVAPPFFSGCKDATMS